jgi:hypothetical protein
VKQEAKPAPAHRFKENNFSFMSHPKVTRRKRRTETLKNKMKEYSKIFNVNVAIIIQDRATMQKQTFTFAHDPGWAIVRFVAPVVWQGLTIVLQTPSSRPQSSENVTWPESKVSIAERLKQRFEQLNLECPP